MSYQTDSRQDSASSRSGQQVRILVVDDNEGDYYLIKSLLTHAGIPGYDLSWNDNLYDVVDTLANFEPHLCLIDYGIGVESGLDLIQSLAETHPHLPTVLLTGQADQEVDMAAMRAGASDFLEKSRLDSQLLDRAVRYAIEQKRNERQLAALAERDDLTGLYNRAGFSERLGTALSIADRTERMLGVLYLDLDRFKHVNDSLGHPVGDALLREVARRLVSCCRSTDVIARMGGDEFAIVATHLKESDGAGRLSEKILSALAEPFELSGHIVHVGISIGVTMYPDDIGDADQLLMNADMALYRAKQDGRNRYMMFDADMDLAAKARRRTESDLHHAIANDELFLDYQPIIDAGTGEIASMEALVRWRHNGEVRYPDAFIEIAETSNLIGPLGEWVLRDACRTAAAWASGATAPVPVAINLSAAQLALPGLSDTVHQVLKETGLPPQLLELEITESVMIPNLEEGQATLKELRESGVRVSIDDFGTGYTALHVLRNLPVDKLKIDRSFIHEIGDDEVASPIVKAVVEIGRAFGLEVVAEGVETEHQRRCLRALGADYLQGFLISRPTTPADIETWLDKHAVA